MKLNGQYNLPILYRWTVAIIPKLFIALYYFLYIIWVYREHGAP